MTIISDFKLVAACGLYCGSCRAYRNGKCPGCSKNIKASWCKIRTCNQEQGLATCAECKEFSDPMLCKKYNNPIAKIFGFVLRSNRAACIAQIKALGLEGHAQIMAETKRQSLPR